jgi:hypothetical protein
MLILTDVRLALDEPLTLHREGEVSKEERLNGVCKESLLRFLTILVHYITDDREIDMGDQGLAGSLGMATLFNLLNCALNEIISLVVAVGKNEHHHTLGELKLFFLTKHLIFEYLATKHVLNKGIYN